MNKSSIYLSIIFFVFCNLFHSQNILKGKIVDYEEYPISKAIISIGNERVESSPLGFFEINYQTEADSIFIFKENYIEFKGSLADISKKNTVIILASDASSATLSPILFRSTRKSDISSIGISGDKTQLVGSISGGVEDVLKTFGSVNSNSELSSQYMVRGGNFDENLVYINGNEIYKPQLARTGQQEGLSIINPNMVSFLSFSAGGFEAAYGDKMSSVLDIYYKRPLKNSLSLEASLIGGALTLETSDKKNKLTSITGIRYRNTQFILNTLEGDTDFNPTYLDAQSLISYALNDKFKFNFFTAVANNDFEVVPKTRETDFGTALQPVRLTVLYNGRENDSYQTINSTLGIFYQPIKKLKIHLNPFVYHSVEEEYFDIAAGYLLEEVDPSTGEPVTGFGTGGQINHARNDLDMLIYGASTRVDYQWNVNRKISFGYKYQTEDIRDFQTEWQLIDSLGYSLPRPIPSPGDLDNSDLELDYYIQSRINIKSQRWSAFSQFNQRILWNATKIDINAGIRATHWDFNNETNISPRLQLALKPDWNTDILFRFASGIYYQPPFYKEIRYLDGTLNKNIKSQKSIHFILGTDYELTLFKRPFKITAEAYYKDIDDLIPYYVDNVRLRYTAENNARGKIYGIDTRLNGEFVPGVESWLTVSYGKAIQNIDEKGDIPLPTDPRFKVGLFFQDYMKFLPSMRASLTAVYASGLPSGAPLFTDPYNYQSYLPAYKRVDVALTKVFKDEKDFNKTKGFVSKFKELSLGLEIFNIFDVTNTVSNQWLRDVNSSRSFAVPNRLTGRFFNLKLRIKI